EIAEPSSPSTPSTGISSEEPSSRQAGAAVPASSNWSARKAVCASCGAPLRHDGHPTPKSVALMTWLCRLVTPPGGLVLDCFAGSGSTLVACQRLGFDSIGVEMNPEYVAIAEARVKGDQPLFAKVSVE